MSGGDTEARTDEDYPLSSRESLAPFKDRFQYGFGMWMLMSGACSVFADVPGNFAVVSLAGGGGLLLAAAYFALRPPCTPAAS